MALLEKLAFRTLPGIMGGLSEFYSEDSIGGKRTEQKEKRWQYSGLGLATLTLELRQISIDHGIGSLMEFGF